MRKDPFHPLGWIALFNALARPCECECSTTLDMYEHHVRTRICRKNPFPILPDTGYRWYREFVNSQKQAVAA